MDEEIDSKFILFSPWTFLFLLLIIILGNLFIIDIALFWKNDSKPAEKQIAAKIGSVKISPTTITQQACASDCKAEIQKAVALAIIKPQSTSISSVKEFFVTIGSGSSTSDTWSDISGAQSYIDSNAYTRIKTVTFEVSLHTPTGNQMAYARLYNVTDSHPVWNSEVNIEGGTPQLKISSPITLGQGSKLYQVQMKTQLGSRTNLENAKVHIATY